MNQFLCNALMLLTLALACLLFSAPAHAQSEAKVPATTHQLEEQLQRQEERLAALNQRIEGLEDEHAELLDKLEAYEQLSIRTRRGQRVYGDIAMRYHGLFPRGSRRNDLQGGNELSRPEYRLRLGVTGYLFDSDKHRFKYDVRLSTIGSGEYTDAPLGAPTQGYTPAGSFGQTSAIGFDRFTISHTYKQSFRLGGGRFGSVFEGTQLIYDNDLGLDGIFALVDLGVALKLYERKGFDDPNAGYESDGVIRRLQLRAAGFYLAQNNRELPEPVADSLPVGGGGQLYTKFRLPGTDNSMALAFGFHYFDGEEAIAPNIGTGTTASTTNLLNSSGRVNSEFVLFDVYSELIFLEQQIASFKVFGHGTWNVGLSVPDGAAVEKEEPWGFVLGAQWGALRLKDKSDFRIRYTWSYIPADAAIPELNGDDLNTNFVGHEVSVSYTIISNVIAIASYQIGWRENEALAGVGRTSDGSIGSPSNDREERWRLGLLVRF